MWGKHRLSLAPLFPLLEVLRLGRLGLDRGLYMGCTLDAVRWKVLVDTSSTVSLIRAGLLFGTDTVRVAEDNDALWIITVIREQAVMTGKKTVAVGNRALEYDFFVGGIQDACITKLNLLE